MDCIHSNLSLRHQYYSSNDRLYFPWLSVIARKLFLWCWNFVDPLTYWAIGIGHNRAHSLKSSSSLATNNWPDYPLGIVDNLRSLIFDIIWPLFLWHYLCKGMKGHLIILIMCMICFLSMGFYDEPYVLAYGVWLELLLLKLFGGMSFTLYQMM